MLGIIGGSGWSSVEWLQIVEQRTVSTPFGVPSGPLQFGYYNGSQSSGTRAALDATVQATANSAARICFLARHGSTHTIPPHKVNYRANVQAMYDAGVDSVISINAVGACNAVLQPGSLVLPDQIIDYTYGREHTFFDSLDDYTSHVEFTEPLSSALRAQLLECASQLALALKDGATYGCTQGPRFETAAEIRRLLRDGCDLVGMTLMPEAALCRERNLPLASICMVVNAAAGIGDEPISMAGIENAIATASGDIRRLIELLLAVVE